MPDDQLGRQFRPRPNWCRKWPNGRVLAKPHSRRCHYPVLVPNLQFGLGACRRRSGNRGVRRRIESFSRRKYIALSRESGPLRTSRRKRWPPGSVLDLSCVLGLTLRGGDRPGRRGTGRQASGHGLLRESRSANTMDGHACEARQLIERVRIRLPLGADRAAFPRPPMARRWQIASLVSNSAFRSRQPRWRVLGGCPYAGGRHRKTSATEDVFTC